MKEELESRLYSRYIFSFPFDRRHCSLIFRSEGKYRGSVNAPKDVENSSEKVQTENNQEKHIFPPKAKPLDILRKLEVSF